MLSVILFIIAILFSVLHLTYRKDWSMHRVIEVMLSYFFFFNVGCMGILAAYAHIFMGAETAQMIGWAPHSPFQFEIGMANLSYGTLGILAYWYGGRFWNATLIGWSIFLLGCFVGHVKEYYLYHNNAPWNMGVFVWFNDQFMPLLMLTMLGYLRFRKAT